MRSKSITPDFARFYFALNKIIWMEKEMIEITTKFAKIALNYSLGFRIHFYRIAYCTYLRFKK